MLKTSLIRLAKGSLVYGTGSILQRFMGLLLLPLFTRVLSPEDYGIVTLVSLVGVAISGFLTLGTGNSMGILYFREKDLSKRFSIIWSNILLMAGNGIFCLLIIYLLSPMLSNLIFKTEVYANLIVLSLLGNVLTVISDPWLAYLRFEEKAKDHVVLTLISSFLTISLSVYFVLVIKLGVFGLILATPISHGIMLIVNWRVIGSKVPFAIDVKVFKPLLKIGFPSIFGLFAFLLIDYADRQMIERILGLSAVGIYSNGYNFGFFMIFIVGAFGTAWSPFFMSFINKPEEASLVFSKVLYYYVIGCGCLVVLFFLMAKPVVMLMTAPAFHEAHLVVGIIACSYFFKGCYQIFLPGIYYAEKLYVQSIIEWSGAFANIFLNLWLIPIYGILGAAFATLASYLVLPLLAWFFSRNYLKVDYQWKRITLAIFILLSAIFALFGISFYFQNNVISALLNGILAVGIFFLALYKTSLLDEEKAFIWRLIRVKD